MLKPIDELLQGSFPSALRYEFWPAIDLESQKLLIVLHGRGDSPEGFHFFPGMLDVDELHTLFLQAPDAYGPGFSWYDLPPNQASGIVRSRKMIFDLLDGLRNAGVPSRNIFLCGFSQGCLMVLDVALRYPHALGGVVGISGYVFFEEEYPQSFSPVAREQRIWISHGLQDEMLPFQRTQDSVQKLQSLGLTIEWNPLNKGHTVDESDEMDLIRGFIRTQLDSN
jgi:phospholipase/carboxylesterase